MQFGEKELSDMDTFHIAELQPRQVTTKCFSGAFVLAFPCMSACPVIVNIKSGGVSGFFHLSNGDFPYSAVLDDVVAEGWEGKIKDEEAQDRKSQACWGKLCDRQAELDIELEATNESLARRDEQVFTYGVAEGRLTISKTTIQIQIPVSNFTEITNIMIKR